MLAESWPEEIAKQEAFNTRYRETGELLGAYGLADAAAAKLVRRKGRRPAVTDGPFLEAKEYIAASTCWTGERGTGAEDRGPHAVGGPGAGGAVAGPARVAGAEEVSLDRAIEDLLRELAPQVLGALVRRYGHFDACEDATQEALLAAASSGRRGAPANPRGWLITVAVAPADGRAPQRAGPAPPRAALAAATPSRRCQPGPGDGPGRRPGRHPDPAASCAATRR